MSLSKSGSNSSTQTGYRLATNTWLRKHRALRLVMHLDEDERRVHGVEGHPLRPG